MCFDCFEPVSQGPEALGSVKYAFPPLDLFKHLGNVVLETWGSFAEHCLKWPSSVKRTEDFKVTQPRFKPTLRRIGFGPTKPHLPRLLDRDSYDVRTTGWQSICIFLYGDLHTYCVRDLISWLVCGRNWWNGNFWHWLHGRAWDPGSAFIEVIS